MLVSKAGVGTPNSVPFFSAMHNY